MDREVEKILTQAEQSRREKRKTQDRGQMFRADPSVKEVMDSERRRLAEIQAADRDCGPLFARAESLGLRKFVDPRPWLENFEQCRAKLLSIPVALQWIDNLTEADFANAHSANYPWGDQIRCFLSEFYWNQSGGGGGVAASMRHFHGLVEHWIKVNSRLIGAEKTLTAIIPPDRTPPHRTLNNLDE